LGEAVKVSADRLAWRSFWLGLASLVFLFMTGIPAVYYGIRSLLRMRFSKPGPRDRFAAVSGTIMGAVFGLTGGFLVIMAGMLLAVGYYSLDIVSDPGQIRQQFESNFEPTPLGKLKPHRLASVFNSQYFFDFVDNRNSGQRNIRVHMIHCKPNMQQMRNQVIGHLSKRTVTSTLQLERRDSEILKWEMGGRQIDVRKTTFDIVGQESGEADPSESESPDEPNDQIAEAKASDTIENELDEVDSATDDESEVKVLADTTQVVQYFGFYSDEQGMTGMTVATRFPNPNLSESQIKKMFAEIKHKSR
jgi:hypothetical protein